MKTINSIIVNILICTLLTQCTAFAAGAGIAIEPIYNEEEKSSAQSLPSPTQEELSQIFKKVEATDPVRLLQETMGGRIISKQDGSEIRLECIERSATDECLKVQYVHQTGILRKPISETIEYSALVSYFDGIKTKIADAIKNRMIEQPESMTVMPVTKKMYIDDYGDMGPASLGFGLFGGIIGGAGTGLILFNLFAVAAAVTTPIGIGVGILLLIWPITTDLITLPFRGAARGIKKISIAIKNKKLKKRYKRISKALVATVTEGNRTVEMKSKDFDLLLSLFEAKPSNPTGALK